MSLRKKAYIRATEALCGFQIMQFHAQYSNDTHFEARLATP